MDGWTYGEGDTGMTGYAVQFEGNRRATLADHPRLERCEAGHVLGATLYSLISPGTELASGFTANLESPHIPGYAAVFRVEQVGENVTTLKAGDLALCMGPHRSWQHVQESHAVKLPDGIAADVAVLARLMNISMTSLMTTAAKPGEAVLVTGLGPVGFLAAQLFRRCGYEVVACDPDSDRLAAARASGIPHVYAQPPVDDPAWQGRIALALECAGRESAALDGCRLVRKKGEVVLVGVPWKRHSDAFAHELLSLIFHQYAVVRSGWEWEVPIFPGHFQPISYFDNIRKCLAWLAEGLFDAAALTRKVSPRQANEVYTDLADRREKALFVLFDWQL